MKTHPLEYAKLTWPEVAAVVAEDRVCVIPVATLEDHGPHLPIDTDLLIVSEVCRRACAEAAEDAVLLPAIPHGYDPHHMDFPGPISISWDTFTRYLTDVGVSLARHGFKRMLFVNGHGSNQSFVDAAARLVGVEHPDVLAASSFYLVNEAGRRVIEEVRESARGGMGHACELETSIYLVLDETAVKMEDAVDETGFPASDDLYMDWSDGPLRLMPRWSSFSRTGVQGRPTLARAEKGRVLLDAAVEEIAGYIGELRTLPLPVRREPSVTPE